MNSKFPIFLIALIATAAAHAADPAAPSCCATPAPEPKASCCAEMPKPPGACCAAKGDAAAGAACCAEKSAAAPDAGCCAPESKPVATASCCAEETARSAFTQLSLYQLDATWTDDGGNAVNLASFRGRPVVLAMFFASCEYACPVLTSDMKRMRELLPEPVRNETEFVLVSFDVARDTPEALRSYRERSNLDGEGWTLLRGEADAVQELAMLLGVKYKQDARGQFSHSNLFTVLNQEGEIIHQRAGLMGDVSEAANAVVVAAR